MRNLILYCSLFLMLIACKDEPKTGDHSKSVAGKANPDSVAIAESLHTFFQWYGETGDQLITKYNFIKTTGKSAQLDESMLAEYFAEFLKSGVVSAELVADETKFYRACAELWKNENAQSGYSGFQIDRYYCQNDFDAAEFLTAGVKFRLHGDRAKVLLDLKETGKNRGGRAFEMKKEGGKWLLAKLRCNSGVAY